MERKHRKMVNFDLSISQLKKYYSEKNYQQAYDDLKRFFGRNGFAHRQGSAYVSKMGMSIRDMFWFSRRLVDQFWWLPVCAEHFDVTDIGEQYDLLPLLNTIDKAEWVERYGVYYPDLNILVENVQFGSRVLSFRERTVERLLTYYNRIREPSPEMA